MTESYEEWLKRRKNEDWSKTNQPDFKPEGKRLPREQKGLDVTYGRRGIPESKFEGRLNAAEAREAFLTPKARSGLGVLVPVPRGKAGVVTYRNDTGRIAEIRGKRVDSGVESDWIEFQSKHTGIPHRLAKDSVIMWADEQPKFTRVPSHYHGGLTTAETCTICRNFKEE